MHDVAQLAQGAHEPVLEVGALCRVEAATDLVAVAGPGDRYEVRCRLHPAEGADLEDWLVGALGELGDVVHCSPLGETWTVEVWTLFPGAAVEVLCDAGRPRELHIAVLPAA